jgi:hypothetical protein
MPCFSAFCAARALPSGVFGPRDLAPFRRLASARALLTGTAARGAAPTFDMAGFLQGMLEEDNGRQDGRPKNHQLSKI